MTDFIHITVLLSGKAAESSADPSMEYALAPPARLGMLLELIGAKRPALAKVLPSCLCRVNGKTVDRDTMLSDGDRIDIDVEE